MKLLSILLTAMSVFAASGAVAGNAGELAADCEACHGPNGVSTDALIPSIAGMSQPYLSDSLLAYMDVTRPCPEVEYLTGAKKGEKSDMCKISGALSEADAEAVAGYFAGKTWKSAKQSFDPAKAERGAKVHEVLCEKCHADGGQDPEDDTGILAGQWLPYLEANMADYKSGARPMIDKMAKKFEKLTDADIEAVIHFYASQQ